MTWKKISTKYIPGKNRHIPIWKCPYCGYLQEISPELAYCPRCGGPFEHTIEYITIEEGNNNDY